MIRYPIIYEVGVAGFLLSAVVVLGHWVIFWGRPEVVFQHMCWGEHPKNDYQIYQEEDEYVLVPSLKLT